MKNTISLLWLFPRKLLARWISVYQKTLSPDTGWLRGFFPYGYCKFHPTCSEYGKQALLKYGVVWGGMKTLWRIFRCNPWTKGGEDKP